MNTTTEYAYHIYLFYNIQERLIINDKSIIRPVESDQNFLILIAWKILKIHWKRVEPIQRNRTIFV